MRRMGRTIGVAATREEGMIDTSAWLSFARREVGLTGVFLLFALVTLIFVVADSAAGVHFDRQLLLALREPGDHANPVGSATFEEAVRDITALGSFAVLTLVTLIAV